MIAKYFWRVVHVLTSLIFICCSIFLTFSVISNYNGHLDNFASFIILSEAVAFIGNGGKCPLRKFHRKYEKDEELMKVFLPGRTGDNLLKIFTIYTTFILVVWSILEFLIK